jgi:uncharacterized membrane protein
MVTQALAATLPGSKSSATDISNDGEITITNVIGGVSHILILY